MIEQNHWVPSSALPPPAAPQRTVPAVSAARLVAGVVMAFLGIVSAAPVVGATDVPIDADTTSEPVPDEPTVDEPPCESDISTAPTPSSSEVPTITVAPTTTTPPIDPATETTIETTDPDPNCEDTSTNPVDPTVPATEPEAVPSTEPTVESPTVPSSTVASTVAPSEPAIEPPTVAPPEPQPEPATSTLPPAPAESPPDVTSADASTGPDDVRAAPTAEPPLTMPNSPVTPFTPDVAPPVIPAADNNWTTGTARWRAPRDVGPSAPRPGRTPAGQRVTLAGDIEVILATIRQLESGGRYHVRPNAARASGAYQYIPSTWRDEGGYPQAYLAPPSVQDARARADVERILTMYGGDVSMVPVMWYYPRAASDPTWMDRVPNPAGGNRLTIREYQAKWMERFIQNALELFGTYVPAPDSPAAVSVLSGMPEPPDDLRDRDDRVDLATLGHSLVDVEHDSDVAITPFTLDDVTVSDRTVELAARSVPPEVSEKGGIGPLRSIVFPVLGPVTYANGWGDPRDGGARRHEGTDIIGVTMQPLLAATDGQITQLRLEPRGRSGVAVSVSDADGWRYNYFHANNDTPASDDGEAHDGFRLAPGLELGDDVVAGQIIGYLGDSGNAEDSVPHLHFEFRDPTGRAVPSYWSLLAAEARQACTIGLGPWSTPSLTPELDPEATEPIGADPVEPGEPAVAEPEREIWHTVVTPMYGEGQWIIDSDGRVTATGDAALIMPSRTLECAPGPATPFGTDAAGWDRFDDDALTGTVLEGADLTHTVLDAELAQLFLVEAVDPAPDPLVFVEPASGERIIVILTPDSPENERTPIRSGRPGGSLDAVARASARAPIRVVRIRPVDRPAGNDRSLIGQRRLPDGATSRAARRTRSL